MTKQLLFKQILRNCVFWLTRATWTNYAQNQFPFPRTAGDIQSRDGRETERGLGRRTEVAPFCARRRARRSLLSRTSTCAKGENQQNRGRATRRLKYTKPRRKRNRKRTRKENRGRSFLRTSTCAASPFAHVDVREGREPAKQGKSNKKTKIYKAETEEK